ncbi:MAG: L-histidine N(alpha)-methyltransferase [Deltaproteobacteria bacterium]|nr:L-histidine N(alpha)-methyltransferase [Deltaproteobacteria bacterium]
MGRVRANVREAAIEELRAALNRQPPEIPCKYLYDDRGSWLFEQITTLPEYFPSRCERELLRTEAAPILDAAGGDVSEVVELGSGAAHKTAPLLHAILGSGHAPRYVAVDISEHALKRTRELLADEPGVAVTLVRGDYEHALALPARSDSGQRLVIFLGGTLGNMEDSEARALFLRVRAELVPGDALLVGANLPTDHPSLEAAYNDAAGVTAEFNKNALRNVNAVCGSRFDEDDFVHHAFWNAPRRRIEMWLRAQRAVEIPLGELGGTLRLGRGEGLRTEISRRFARAELESLLVESALVPTGWFTSEDSRFAIAVARVPEPSALQPSSVAPQ